MFFLCLLLCLKVKPMAYDPFNRRGLRLKNPILEMWDRCFRASFCAKHVRSYVWHKFECQTFLLELNSRGFFVFLEIPAAGWKEVSSLI